MKITVLPLALGSPPKFPRPEAAGRLMERVFLLVERIRLTLELPDGAHVEWIVEFTDLSQHVEAAVTAQLYRSNDVLIEHKLQLYHDSSDVTVGLAAQTIADALGTAKS